jgi:hypothetical protein
MSTFGRSWSPSERNGRRYVTPPRRRATLPRRPAATLAAVAATADALATNLAQMQFLEDARKTVRQIKVPTPTCTSLISALVTSRHSGAAVGCALTLQGRQPRKSDRKHAPVSRQIARGDVTVVEFGAPPAHRQTKPQPSPVCASLYERLEQNVRRTIGKAATFVLDFDQHEVGGGSAAQGDRAPGRVNLNAF